MSNRLKLSTTWSKPQALPIAPRFHAPPSPMSAGLKVLNEGIRILRFGGSFDLQTKCETSYCLVRTLLQYANLNGEPPQRRDTKRAIIVAILSQSSGTRYKLRLYSYHWMHWSFHINNYNMNSISAISNLFWETMVSFLTTKTWMGTRCCNPGPLHDFL